jgi:SCP-2 sterol transfer family
VTEQADRQRPALHRMAKDDPELAGRLILMTLPGAASTIGGTMSYVLDVKELGAHRASISGGRARVARLDGDGEDGDADFRLQTDARTLADLATGRHGPLGLMMRGRLRIRGKRRKAMKLRRMSSGELSMAEVVDAGGTLDPDVLYRALPYLIDPEWTEGHNFTVRYVVTGEGGGTWYATARDGQPLEVTREDREAAGTATASMEDYQRLASGQVSPSVAMQNQLTKIDGRIHPVTLLGRWIARAQGMDDAELKREAKQQLLQDERASMYAGGGDKDGDGLLDYRQLYALWERQSGVRRALPARRDPRGPAPSRDGRARGAGPGAEGCLRVRAALRDRRHRVRLLWLHVAPDLRLRLPDAPAPHEGAGHRDPARRRVHAGTDRRDDRVHRSARGRGAGRV